MARQQDAKGQKRLFFGGLIIGSVIGVLGNLAVSSDYELVHLVGTEKIPSYSLAVACAFVGSVCLLIFYGRLSWIELNKNQ